MRKNLICLVMVGIIGICSPVFAGEQYSKQADDASLSLLAAVTSSAICNGDDPVAIAESFPLTIWDEGEVMAPADVGDMINTMKYFMMPMCWLSNKLGMTAAENFLYMREDVHEIQFTPAQLQTLHDACNSGSGPAVIFMQQTGICDMF